MSESESIIMGLTETSQVLGIPVNTLKAYRATDKGPISAVIGGKVKYRRSDVLAWVDEQFEKSAKGADVKPGKPVFTPLGNRSLIDA